MPLLNLFGTTLIIIYLVIDYFIEEIEPNESHLRFTKIIVSCITLIYDVIFILFHKVIYGEHGELYNKNKTNQKDEDFNYLSKNNQIIKEEELSTDIEDT